MQWNSRAMRSRVRRVFTWLATLSLVLGVCGTALMFVLMFILHVRPVVVLSGSMAPFMPVGGIALMEPVDVRAIKVGDVIGFKAPGNPKVTITHRVIEFLPGPGLVFQTKGDAVEGPDPFTVPAKDVIGQVRYVAPYLGIWTQDLNRLVRTREGFTLAIGLPAAAVMAGELSTIYFVLSPGKRRDRRRKVWLERRKKRLARRKRRR